MKKYTLIGADGVPYTSTVPGTLGGHRADRIYGRLDCPGAARAIARGGYIANRVFFADADTAVAAGFRPCAGCLPDDYRAWKARGPARLTHTTVATPIGELLLVADADHDALREIRFDATDIPAGSTPGTDGVLATAARQLTEYTNNERTAFDLPLRPASGGPFERRVWKVVAAIPHGTTMSYGEIARELGARTAARAVGAANGRNPLPIVVPCHRVVGSTGRLTGYAGGLKSKRRLLEHEGALLPLT
jgi:methylated-DNA-[protein]-cysteine S-methyltransferase